MLELLRAVSGNAVGRSNDTVYIDGKSVGAIRALLARIGAP